MDLKLQWGKNMSECAQMVVNAVLVLVLVSVLDVHKW